LKIIFNHFKKLDYVILVGKNFKTELT